MAFLIFDIEGVVSQQRVLRAEKPVRQYVGAIGETDAEMVTREVDRICKLDPAVAAGTKSCFVPARYHEPVVVSALLVDDNLAYIGHKTIAAQKPSAIPTLMVSDPRETTKQFWDLFQWAAKSQQSLVLVTFGGSSYDLPVLEATALEYGLPLKDWMVMGVPPYKSPRHPSGTDFHLDLSTYLGQGRGGGLSYWARLVGLPGKMDSNGAMVSQMLGQAGGLEAVSTYCVLDVLNTYGVFFAVRHAAGYVPANYRGNPIFEDVMTKCLAGLGPEATRFELAYRSDPGVPF